VSACARAGPLRPRIRMLSQAEALRKDPARPATLTGPRYVVDSGLQGNSATIRSR
jgi:hypothetical protein